MIVKKVLFVLLMLIILIGCGSINPVGLVINPVGTVIQSLSESKYDGFGYDKNGYNKLGYNREGYNKSGYNKFGYDKFGYDKSGYNKSGYYKDGYNREGYNQYGYNKEGYNKSGYYKDGYNREGYNQYGYNKEGYNKSGYYKDGYNREGYNQYGYNKEGYDKYGFKEEKLTYKEDNTKIVKVRSKMSVNIFNDKNTIIGTIPKDFVTDYSQSTGKILKPKGNVNLKDFEQLSLNNDSNYFYTINNTPIYIDIEKMKVLTNIEKGKVIKKLYYLNDENLMYIENDTLKGWIEPKNIGFIKKEYNKVAVVNNNTNAYKNINGLIKSTYSSGDILEFDNIETDNQYYYSENIGWLNGKEVMLIDELEKVKRIFTNKKEVKFNSDFIGNNYKNVSIGTEYKLLGTTDIYYLVESKSTGEKGWIAKSDMSFEKPDLNEPTIIITDTRVEKIEGNNMLTVTGKIYDDTAIKSFLFNDNKMSVKPLNTYDKLSYVPEVGYSFSSQWSLIEGMENNVEIKVIDREGKIYSKVLKYTPELKTININEFKIENIVKQIPKLEYAINLKDENGDGILTGSEKIDLIVTVKNIGEGEAKNVNIKINNPSNNSIFYPNTYPMGTIMANETKTAVIEFTGKDSLSIGKALYDLTIEEGSGFNPFPAKFSFNVEPKLNPKLEILDYAIDDESKNGQIEPEEKVDLFILVQNTGEGDAKNTIFELDKKDEGIVYMSEPSFKYDVLKSGESKKIKVSFTTNYEYKGNGDLPFNISLYTEKDTTKTEKPIVLAMNKVVPTIKEVNLEAKKKEVVVASKISLMSDVDDTSKLVINVPNLKKWAVVIGVENYKKVPDVEFAERDALVTKDYFNKLLGVPSENIFYLSNTDATKTELETLLTSTLKNRVENDDEVYFYFSGHGVPTNEGDSYLLLNDSDPTVPKTSAYSVKKLYEDLGSLKTSKSYAFLDTCFSGQVARGNEKDSLLPGTRAVMKVNDVSLAYKNLSVYTATGKDQLSNSFKEQGHGLFTYYMLKGLGGEADINKDGKVSEQELQNYIKSNVSAQSRKLYGESRYQEPQLKNMVDKDIY